MQGRGGHGVALALFQQLGDIFTAVSVEGQGVPQGAGHFVGAVELAQRDDLLDVVRGMEAFFAEFATVAFGVCSQAQEGSQAGLVAGAVTLRQEFLDMIGVADVLAAVVTAQVGGDQLLVVIAEQLVRIDFEGQLLGSVAVRHRVATGLKKSDAATTIGAGRPNDPAVIRTERQRLGPGLLLGKPFEGFDVGLAVDTHVGYGIPPWSGGGIDGLGGGDLPTAPEVLFDVTHAVSHAPFFVRLFDLAGDGDEAVVGGEVQVARVETGRRAQRMFAHPNLEIIDHYFSGDAAKELEGMAVAGEELFHPWERVNST